VQKVVAILICIIVVLVAGYIISAVLFSNYFRANAITIGALNSTLADMQTGYKGLEGQVGGLKQGIIRLEGINKLLEAASIGLGGNLSQADRDLGVAIQTAQGIRSLSTQIKN